jgi:NADP-dependent 3-hydroxy acid dehydrogenase YdfG
MTDQNRAILVTGASGGIGRAVCTRLAQAGHSLVLAARDETRLRALCDHLSSVHQGERCSMTDACDRHEEDEHWGSHHVLGDTRKRTW